MPLLQTKVRTFPTVRNTVTLEQERSGFENSWSVEEDDARDVGYMRDSGIDADKEARTRLKDL